MDAFRNNLVKRRKKENIICPCLLIYPWKFFDLGGFQIRLMPQTKAEKKRSKRLRKKSGKCQKIVQC